ncbi:MAG TPA: beta-ketoacyl-ACP synthase [Acetobacteraceae bacterium]|nr:beta-ketoacyl-ACP synthase [Acetobacteraceae bacterium]
MTTDRDPMITGIGLISCLGEGEAAHMAALDDFVPVVDEASFAPYTVHPMTTFALDQQIPKRGDQRQMEPWQRFGVYAAGLALDSAKIKGDVGLLERMDMIVAAGGGERDYAVDAAILAALPKQTDPDLYLNEHLLADIRPTLFLAQLSNLLAGNISIVHGVIGSSRTFMGEEASGADALHIACARIQAGQSEICLVGGSFNAQRPDAFLHNAMGHALWRGPFAPVWSRLPRGGVVLGSVGCFLVIESRAHARARGVTPKAHLAGVRTDRCNRAPGEAAANAERQINALGGAVAASAVISGTTGAPAATAEERTVIDRLGLPVRAAATALGNSVEPSFPTSVALAAMCVDRGRLFPPLEPAETPSAGPLKGVFVTSWGIWRGEATALVVPAQESGRG